VRKRHEHRLGQTVASTSLTDTEGEWGMIRHVQAHGAGAKEPGDALAVNTEEEVLMDGTFLAVQALATSEANRTAALRPWKPPSKSAEPTKPLSLTGRKTLNTMRSIPTGLGERKQLHASASHRDLAASVQHAHGHGKRVRTTAPASMRAGLAHDREAPRLLPATSSHPPPDVKLPPPSTATLPTPPNSSSALSFLAGETKPAARAPPPPRRPRRRWRR